MTVSKNSAENRRFKYFEAFKLHRPHPTSVLMERVKLLCGAVQEGLSEPALQPIGA